ncbi:amino acid ABC transporter permease [Micromonospora sp. NPDC049102]|uniref:amino acid ABC transporter permease n=1 Tax=Micromonospora sp. NPDC049102 TaxID=3364265 RepID=UPI00371F5C07
MRTEVHRLFDPPGPRAIRRNRVITVAVALVLPALALLVISRFAAAGQLEPGKWSTFGQWPVVRYLLDGVGKTLLATAVATGLTVPIGLLVALARLARNPVPRLLAAAYVELFRAVPVLLLLFACMIALPRYGMRMPIFWQLVVPVTLSNIAVIAEIFRAGIIALPRGQTEASYAIGMSYWQSMRLVLIPQAVRRLRPALVTQLVRLLKESTLGFVVSYTELLYAGKVLGEYTHALIQTYLVIAVIYIAINSLLSWFAGALERRSALKAY